MRIQTLLLNSFLKVDQFTITNLLLWFEVLIYKVDQRNQITWGTLPVGMAFKYIPNYLKTKHKKLKFSSIIQETLCKTCSPKQIRK